MKRLLVFFFILTSFLLAENLTNNESSVFGTPINSETTNTQNVIKKNYNGGKNLYLTYLKYPKHVYKNQRFEIEIKALITRKNFDSIQTRFLSSKNMTPVNPKSKWEKSTKENNTYKNKFFFKASHSKFKMPTIEVRLYKGKTLIESRRINSEKVTYSEIAKSDERYSGIIAKELTVIGSKSKQYTNKEALTIIDINAKNSNLEDFNLKGIEEQNITVMEDNYPEQHLIYSLVIPIYKKNIIFNYYNTTNNRFEKIVVPIVFEEELVSTQTDLNPNNSSFEFYKKVAVGVFALILLLLFIWKKNFYILVLFLLVTIFLMVFAMPNKNITLKEGTVIYILPTKNSTIFQKVNKPIVVEDMKRKNGFIKVMFGSGAENFIGWVKEEDAAKN